MQLSTDDHGWRGRVLAAWLLPVVVCLLQLLFWENFKAFPLALLYPSVFFAALLGGLWGGIGATALAAALVWYFLLPPQFSVAVQDGASFVAMSVFVGVGVLFSLILYAWRRSQQQYAMAVAATVEAQVQARVQAQEMVQKLNLATEAAEVGIWSLDIGDKRLDWDERIYDMYGVPESMRSDCNLDLWRSRVHRDDLVQAETGLAAAQQQGGPRASVFRILLPGGRVRYIQSASVTECDGEGKPLRIIGVNRDITVDREQAAALAASEQRLRWAMDAANEGLWDWNIATGDVFSSDRWLRLFGYEAGEMPINISAWTSRIHPDDFEGARDALFDHLEGRKPDYGAEFRVITKSGDVRWHQSVGRVVAFDANGQPRRMVGTNTDITERKAAEQKVRDSEERFRLIVQNSPAPIVIWDEHGALRYASPTLTTLLGVAPEWLAEKMAALRAYTEQFSADELSRGRLIGLESICEEHVDSWLQWLQAIRTCAQHPGQKVDVELRLSAAAGEARDLRAILQSIRSGMTGIEIVCVIHDITEHRILERVLRETNAELERQVAERTAELRANVDELRRADAAKNAFLAAISHELRTPLTGILAMSELLEDEVRGPLNSSQMRYVHSIFESGRRLQKTIGDVLLYTDLVAGGATIHRSPCRVVDLCRDVLQSVEPVIAGKRQRLTLEINPLDLQVQSDAAGVSNIVRRLLENAVKFTPEEGCIALSAGEGGGENGGARWVQIAIADTGIGMSEEQVSAAFLPFVQGDLTLARPFDGLGLGLAYVHKMVDLLGGTIAVQSELGQGSRFTVTLPAGVRNGVAGDLLEVG